LNVRSNLVTPNSYANAVRGQVSRPQHQQAITATTKALTTATTAKSPAAVFHPTTATQLAAIDQRPAMEASRANVHAV